MQLRAISSLVLSRRCSKKDHGFQSSVTLYLYAVLCFEQGLNCCSSKCVFKQSISCTREN